MLSSDIIKKIKKIHIKSGRIVNTMMAGQYKSVFRGSGIEFEEVREYTAGDEVKSIDWKVSARLGRPFVKLYREERELIVMLLVDMSASHMFGTKDNLKIETAAEIASILAFNAIRNNDKVGAILFTDQVEKFIPPKKGSSHVWRVIKEMFTFKPTNIQTDIDKAVRFLGRVSRKRTISFLISDFMPTKTQEHQKSVRSPTSVSFIRQLKSLCSRHEIIGVMVSDPGEFQLPSGGIIFVKDSETGAFRYIDASNPAVRAAYQKQMQDDYKQRLNILKSADIDCIEINTVDSVADALVKYFRLRERLKR